jgi:hypothetical protein
VEKHLKENLTSFEKEIIKMQDTIKELNNKFEPLQTILNKSDSASTRGIVAFMKSSTRKYQNDLHHFDIKLRTILNLEPPKQDKHQIHFTGDVS